MTFTELVDAAAERLNLTSPDALARIGRHINAYYKRITSSLGLQPSRRVVVQSTATLGLQTLTFDNIEKIHRVEDRSTTPLVILDEVSNEEMAEGSVGDGQPTAYAIYSTTSGSVTILMNTSPQTQFTLYAEGLSTASTLSGSDEPAFPESFHDLLVSAAVYEERLKQEKPQLAIASKAEYIDRLGDLQLFIAKTAQQDIFQGKRPGSFVSGSSGSGSGGSSVNGASSWTQTGLVTFDRDPAAPFAVTSGSAKVTNLDADLLDGLNSTAFVQTGSVNAVPTSPGDATRFLNGATTPAFAQVKESDLSISDITTNNVTSTKHGLAPKSGADATTFLNGAATPAYAAVKDSDLSTTDITTNNVSTSKHGFTPKAPNDTTKFLRGDATWAAINAKPFLQFTAASNRPPASAFATPDTRNSHAVLDFDGSTDEEAVFEGVLPTSYAAGGLTVELYCAFTSATSGSVRWQAAIERIDVSSLDIDADSFASFQSAGGTAPGTSGQVIKVTVTFTDGSQMDSLAAGEAFRLKIRRDADGTSGTDDITTDAELLRVVVRET